MSAPAKYMLRLTLQGLKHNPCIAFDLKPFYRYKDRLPEFNETLPGFDTALLLRNQAFKERLGFFSLLSLVSEESGEQYLRGKPCGLVIFPDYRNFEYVLSRGLQPYDIRDEDVPCGSLPIDDLNKDALLDDIPFQVIVAEKILKHLPISEELCKAGGPDRDSI